MSEHEKQFGIPGLETVGSEEGQEVVPQAPIDYNQPGGLREVPKKDDEKLEWEEGAPTPPPFEM